MLNCHIGQSIRTDEEHKFGADNEIRPSHPRVIQKRPVFNRR